MTRDQILQILQGNQAALRKMGLKTLVLIGAGSTSGPISPAVEFLAELEPPLSYEHLREVRHFLAALLEHSVDVTLASPNDQAVRPFLDPNAVFIL